MPTHVTYFIRYFLFWLSYFAVDRFIFMFIYHVKLRNIPLTEKLLSFIKAIPLDLSMAAYIAIVPLLAYCYGYFSKSQQLNLSWIKTYNIVLVILFSIVSVINFNIYREWGSKINGRAVEFAVLTPNESLASSASSPVFLIIGVLITLIFTGLYLNFIIVKCHVKFESSSFQVKLVLTFILFGLNFVCIRGFAALPHSPRVAYFSSYPIINHATLNTEWNLFSSLISGNLANKNPYRYTDQKSADLTIQHLFKTTSDSTTSILKTDRPNIVIFILESFTADLTATLGTEKDVTPTLDSLAKNGVLFSKIYATGNRTDKGLLGTLTGYPTVGIGSMVKWPKKMQKLPAISQKLHLAGYQTSFYYGGESNFDNYNTFINDHAYQKLVDRNYFSKQENGSKWGVYDGLVFNRQLKEVNTAQEPFFSTILSLTNHEPFELPVTPKFGNADNKQKFKSTAFYTDSCIGNYLVEAKKQAWYKNTLFVFIADHGHALPNTKHEIYEPQRYHIPMIFYGDVIKNEFRGLMHEKTGSQQDLAATLIAQLKINTGDFKWSKNLLNPSHQSFAYFSWDNGFGFIENDHAVTFDNVGHRILYNNKPTDVVKTNQLLKSGKSYLQSAYQQFINL